MVEHIFKIKLDFQIYLNFKIGSSNLYNYINGIDYIILIICNINFYNCYKLN